MTSARSMTKAYCLEISALFQRVVEVFDEVKIATLWVEDPVAVLIVLSLWVWGHVAKLGGTSVPGVENSSLPSVFVSVFFSGSL